MAKGLELPGGMNVQVPSPEQDLLRVIANGINTLVGQMDMLIRIECGQVQKKTVKERLDAFDAAQAAAQEPPSPVSAVDD